MAIFSHLPLQQEIYQALTGDSTLMTLVTGVYDRVPQDSAYPYVVIGDMAGNDWSSKTTTGMEYLITLHVWSREGGRKETALIMERLHTLLHQSNLTITGQSLVLMQFLSSSLSLENDGWTYHGILRLRALLETTS